MQAPFFLRYPAGSAVSSVPRKSSATEYDVFPNSFAASRLGPMLWLHGASLPEHQAETASQAFAFRSTC